MPLRFNTPVNFKNGKYLMNKYRWKDMLLLLGSVALSLTLIISYSLMAKTVNIFLILVMLLPFLIVAILTLPMSIYHCLYEWITIFMESQLSEKNYVARRGENYVQEKNI